MKKNLMLLFLLLPIYLLTASDTSFIGKVGQQRTLYLTNDNIFFGEILKIDDDGSVQISTKEGILKIPGDQILEETLKIKKTNGTIFTGKLLGEDDVYIQVKTNYGKLPIYLVTQLLLYCLRMRFMLQAFQWVMVSLTDSISSQNLLIILMKT